MDSGLERRETSRTTRWQPLLRGELARRAESTAVEIAAAVEERAEPDGDVSVAGGAAGFALLHAYVARQTGSAQSEELALGWLDRAVEWLDAPGTDLSLYGGMTGVGWAGQHIARLLEVEDIDPDGALDQTLAGMLERVPWRGDFDLISGLVGFGVYALERLPRPEAVLALELIVARLDELAERTSAGRTWFTSPDLLFPDQLEEAPEGLFNLGLAHGVPGVVALLGAVTEVGVAEERARPLLGEAVDWLLDHRLPGDSASAFAYYIAPAREPQPARTAWCYGDPGVAAALLVAAQAAGMEEWKREAVAVAHRAADRRGEDTRAKDAWLCHGAVGLAHLFNRMHQASGDPLLAEAACHWFERTLEMREPGTGVAGYRQPPGMEVQGDGTGFLTGAGGVALALLAATGEIEPGWDRLLAISTRARA
jgi:lantibiotic modifying enzyme